MNDRFFLDTNVFVYSFDPATVEKARVAEGLIDRAIERRKGIVSYQVVQEFFNIALRRFVQPMSLAEAEQYLALTFRPLLAVYPSIALFGEAMRIQQRHTVSWYDSLIVASALEAQCSTLFSEDFQDGRKFGDLTIRNPFAGI